MLEVTQVMMNDDDIDGSDDNDDNHDEVVGTHLLTMLRN